MKEPRVISYRLQVHRASNSPFRRLLRVEKDTIPIRDQTFPTHGALKRPCRVSRRRSVDVVPLNKFCYNIRGILLTSESPLPTVHEEYTQPASESVSTTSLQRPASVPRQLVSVSEEPSHDQPPPQSPKSISGVPQQSPDEILDPRTFEANTSLSTVAREPPSDPVPMSSDATHLLPASRIAAESRASAPGCSIMPRIQPASPESLAEVHNPYRLVLRPREEHKIRDHDAFVRWFPSEAEAPLTQPPSSFHFDDFDLYVHRWANGVQIWIWGIIPGQWKSIDVGYPHPTLVNHRLQLLPSGEPRWVTKKTQTTYKSRKGQ